MADGQQFQPPRNDPYQAGRKTVQRPPRPRPESPGQADASLTGWNSTTRLSAATSNSDNHWRRANTPHFRPNETRPESRSPAIPNFGARQSNVPVQGASSSGPVASTSSPRWPIPPVYRPPPDPRLQPGPGPSNLIMRGRQHQQPQRPRYDRSRETSYASTSTLRSTWSTTPSTARSRGDGTRHFGPPSSNAMAPNAASAQLNRVPNAYIRPHPGSNPNPLPPPGQHPSYQHNVALLHVQTGGDLSEAQKEKLASAPSHKTTGPVLPHWRLSEQRLRQVSKGMNNGKRETKDGLEDTPHSTSSSQRMSTNPRRLRGRTPALSPRAKKTVVSSGAFKLSAGPMVSSPRKVATTGKSPLERHAKQTKPAAESLGGPGPYKAARKRQSMPVTDDEWSSEEPEEEESSESDSDTSLRPPIAVEEDPHPNLSDFYVSESDPESGKEDGNHELEDGQATPPGAAQKEVVEPTAQLPLILIPLPQLQDQEDVKPNIVPHPKLLSALEAALALEHGGLLPALYANKPRLPFLRRSLRQGFQYRCELLGIPTKADSKSVSLRVQYQHIPDVPIYKESLQAWVCPVCWMYGGSGFATRLMLEKHLEWDHPSLFCEWEDLGTNERVTTWKLSVLIPEIPDPKTPRSHSQSLPPIATLRTLPLNDVAGRDTAANASRSQSPELDAHGGDTSILPFVTLSPSASPSRFTSASVPPTSASPQTSAPSPFSTDQGDPFAMDIDSPPENTNSETLRSASESSITTRTTRTTPTLKSESRESTLSVPPTEDSERRSSSTDTDLHTPGPSTSRQSTGTPMPERRSSFSRPKRTTAVRSTANRNVRFESDREDGQSTSRTTTSITPTPSITPNPFAPPLSPPRSTASRSFTPAPIIPPPRDDPLGPAARRPYLPAEPDYEGGTTLYYSTRVGGECLFDLLKTLPREQFGVLVWEVLDREEEIYECSDMADEFKVMHALWARWIMLNQSFFIESYRKGARAFVDEYWRFIHRAAGWDALRYWLITLLANRFLTAEDVALTLKHYESLTGMDDWYPD